MVRRTERAHRDYRVLAARKSGDGIYLGRLYHLAAAHIGKYPRQTLGHHGFARAGRADNENIVPARGGDLKRALDIFLPLDLREVGHMLHERVKPRRGGGFYINFAAHKAQKLVDIFHGVHAYPVRERGFGRIICWNEQLLHAAARRGYCHRQCAVHRAQFPAQGQLADERAVVSRLVDIAVGGKDADEHRQVIQRTGLFLVRRSEIHGHAADRKTVAVILYRGADALARLSDRRIGQADNVKRGQAVGDIHLQQHLISADALQAHGTNLRYHPVSPPFRKRDGAFSIRRPISYAFIPRSRRRGQCAAHQAASARRWTERPS